MTSCTIEWKCSAVKELKNLPKDAIPRILTAVEQFSQNPRPVGARKLVGSEFSYRVRVGSYRVVYSVFESVFVVEIVRVGHRKDVYR